VTGAAGGFIDQNETIHCIRISTAALTSLLRGTWVSLKENTGKRELGRSRTRFWKKRYWEKLTTGD
jgi:hypothetical protein